MLLALRLGGDAYQSASEGLQFGDGDFSFGLGDGVGAVMWAVSLYFCSPLQVRHPWLGARSGVLAPWCSA